MVLAGNGLIQNHLDDCSEPLHGTARLTIALGRARRGVTQETWHGMRQSRTGEAL